MIEKVRSTYLANDPDYAALVLGFFSEVPFFCNIVSTALTTPLATDAILLLDPPADMGGSDYIQASVEAAVGATSSSSVEKTFTLVQSKGFSCSGILQAIVNTTIDLDQVDSSSGGYAAIDSILVELLSYNISSAVTTQLGLATHTIGKGVAGNVTTPLIAEQSISEIFLFDLGVSEKKTFGYNAGVLLQVRMKVIFSAFTPATATTKTIAKCRLNCYRTKSQSSKLLVPVV